MRWFIKCIIGGNIQAWKWAELFLMVETEDSFGINLYNQAKKKDLSMVDVIRISLVSLDISEG